jgi:antitoxin (DNA-binding transcriptional repressor) of toxin-antitoxin stability system
METLTVEEAGAALGRWVDRALAGERIQIRRGDGIVELRPARPIQAPDVAQPAPREALRRLQEDARLSLEQVERYLREVRDERLAAEDRHPA